MPARAAAIGPLGWLASALCHGAILATLIAWHGSPQPLAAAAAIAVTLVVEQASGTESGAPAAQAAGTVADSRLQPAAPDAVLAEPAPEPSALSPYAAMPTPPAVVPEPTPPTPPASRAGIQRVPRSATLRSDPAMAATVAPSTVPSTVLPNAAPADLPAQEVASKAIGAPGPAAMPPAASAALTAALSPPGADYLALIMAWLERHKTYPAAARSRREQGTVLVAFAIDRGGHLLSFGVRRSSGSTELDAAAEDMIRRADPLPAVPVSYSGRELDLVLPVTFALK
jgi:periplasmic protein TonB